MRSAAEVDELRPQRIFAEDVVGPLGDQLHLHRLVHRFVLRKALGLRYQTPLKAQIPVADLSHLLLELLQIFRCKRVLAVEIVVKTVLDRWSNSELGLRVKFKYRSGKKVRRRVPVHFEGSRIFGGQNADRRVPFQRARQVPKVSIYFGNHRFFSKAFRDRKGNIKGPRSFRERFLAPIR